MCTSKAGILHVYMYSVTWKFFCDHHGIAAILDSGCHGNGCIFSAFWVVWL